MTVTKNNPELTGKYVILWDRNIRMVGKIMVRTFNGHTYKIKVCTGKYRGEIICETASCVGVEEMAGRLYDSLALAVLRM